MGDVMTGNCLYVSVRARSGEEQVHLLDLAKGTSTLVFHAFQTMSCWCGFVVSLSRDGSRAAYIGQDIAHPSDVWVADNRFATTRQLTHFNPHIERRSLGVGESVSWRAHGTTFNGTLLLPALYNPGKRYPMLLDVYPGLKTGTDLRNSFVLIPYANPQLFASHGYAVFIPDSVLHIGSPMRDIADVILPGVDKVIAMGIADPDRLGVFGMSYGGYGSLSLIVQTNRFKAAISEAGFSNLITVYAQMHSDGSDSTGWAENDQGRMGGTPWQYRDRYIQNSPFFYLDRVQTPILLQYGGAAFSQVKKSSSPGRASTFTTSFACLQSLWRKSRLPVLNEVASEKIAIDKGSAARFRNPSRACSNDA
jgi:dipeptidyl aminopeptidase/acylaminoacyl peptidase